MEVIYYVIDQLSDKKKNKKLNVKLTRAENDREGSVGLGRGFGLSRCL